MILMTVTSGPYAGQKRNVSAEDPEVLIRSLLNHGWHWEIDFSRATPAESFTWGRLDLAGRCALAIAEGRPVTFLGKVYDDAGKFEDAIVASGRMVTIGRDDANGVVIVAGDREGN